jgi:hypothetical protein
MCETASALALRARIDRGADVLYVTGRPGVPARSREEEPGLVWRYASDTGELVGLTIVDFSTYWAERRAELISRIAGRFMIDRAEAEKLLRSV